MNEIQHGALYIRVSTEDQVEFSPDAQKRALLDYARKNNIYIDEPYIFIDEGFSGRKAEKRPAFMRMISTAKQKPKPFDVILVHKFDRFARSREDSVVYKSLLKKECGIKVISITESMEDDKFGLIIEAMLEAMAEYYSINLSEEVKKGMTEKALRGELQSTPPYGYTVENNKLVIYEPQAQYVRWMYQQILEGETGMFAMARKLNDMGARTKFGKKFENRTVTYILRNPAYAGMLAWTPTGKKNVDFNNPDTIITKAAHEPIISLEDYQKTQQILNDIKAKHTYKARPNSEYRHWLSGLLRCDSCGSILYYVSTKASPGYQCRNYVGGKCDVSHRISLKKLENAVFESLQRVFEDVDYTDYQTVKTPTHENVEKKQLEKRLERIDDKLQRAKEAYLEGIDTAKEYKQNKEMIEAERKQLQKEIEKYKIVQIDMNQFRQQIKDLLTILHSNAPLEEKSKAAHQVIAKIVYHKSKEYLEFYYYL